MIAALSDLHVIEYAQGVNGPFCGKFLADYGASVVKIEPPEGDVARRWGPFPGDVPHPEQSGLFLYFNTNKQGLTLDLRSTAGRKLLWRLLESADVFIENVGAASLGALGIGRDTLREVNPRLITMAISPFGLTGGKRSWSGSDLVHFFAGGLNETMASEAPIRAPGYLTDMACGLTAALVIMGEVLRRRLTGEGAYIDLAEHEAAVQIMTRPLTHYALGNLPLGSGRAGFNGSTGVFPCKDGLAFLFFGVQAHFFPLLCKLIGRGEWAEKPEFRTFEARRKNAAAVYEAVRAWTENRPRSEVVGLCQGAGIPAAPLSSVADLLADPHVQARGVFTTYQHPVTGALTHPTLAPKIAGAPGTVRPAPTLGQHNVDILCGRLGLSRQDLARLRAANGV